MLTFGCMHCMVLKYPCHCCDVAGAHIHLPGVMLTSTPPLPTHAQTYVYICDNVYAG